MSDFDPNMAASIAAENTFQASQERPAAIRWDTPPDPPPQAPGPTTTCPTCGRPL